MSPDLGFAKIFISIFPANQADAVMEKLNDQKSQIRGDLGRRIGKNVRVIPELAFFTDATAEEADKIDKQIVGSADLDVRNKQLLLLEEGVDKVFSKALDQIAKTDRSGDYSNLIKTLLDEATKILGTTEVTVFTNAKDKDVVQSALSQFSGAELSSDTIDCLGGIIIKSKDGTMTFDNTIDARIERLKPLIRKEIASTFGVGN
jgi:V/A-type H+-transporting ATPase subunit E